ncbi:hypothetical protein N781_15620 [Pontibacillus halophilus JSM 076056 = DSM 19796]|uniref:Uncharacterized protein n=1 Tax=Pontibacillus halophilus JSM 076056 = DSM 19796 TaxID=1385510 RepID=A0A0A5IAE0_9BACI|nr:hypothetical protein N781_15620 [Pontibacillus halophilus JSM 076056 = DSM 19796]
MEAYTSMPTWFYIVAFGVFLGFVLVAEWWLRK